MRQQYTRGQMAQKLYTKFAFTGASEIAAGIEIYENWTWIALYASVSVPVTNKCKWYSLFVIEFVC